MPADPIVLGIDQARYDRLMREELDTMCRATWYVYRRCSPELRAWARRELTALMHIRGSVRRIARRLARDCDDIPFVEVA